MYVLKKNAISPCLDIEINVIIIIIIIITGLVEYMGTYGQVPQIVGGTCNIILVMIFD